MQVRFTHVALGVALAASSLAAMAQSTTTTRSGTQTYHQPWERNFWSYSGAAIGRSDYDVSCRSGFACDTDATGGKLFAGGKFHENVGIEGSYVFLGNADRAGGHTRAQVLNLGLVGYVPLGQTVSLLGKLGGLYGWSKTKGTGGPGFATGDENDFGWSYGLGVAIGLTRNVDLRLDWDRYRVKFNTGRDDVDFASVGVAYKF